MTTDLRTPWRATPYSSIVGCGVVGTDGVVIATVPGSKEHAGPIAQLLAASPELLETLREAADAIERWSGAGIVSECDWLLCRARIAINRAMGDAS